MYLTSKSRIKNMKKLHLLHSDYFQKFIIQLVVIYFLANLAEMAIHTLPQLYVIIR